MKKNSTLKKFFYASMFLLGFSSLSAQVTINVPGDFSDLTDALSSIASNESVGNDTEVTINITESIIEDLPNPFIISWTLTNLTINVVGQGPSTIVRAPLDHRPALDGSEGVPFVQVGNAAAEMDGLKINFKNLTFQNWGTTAAGGFWFFNVFVQKTHLWNGTLSFENVVFDSCVGRALFKIFQQPTHDCEFVFNNCYFTNCVSSVDSDGTALLGLINRERGGKLTVKNCTFMNNIFNDTRETGAFNGGIITVNVGLETTSDFTNSIVIENNEMYNNKFISSADDTIQPLIAIKPQGANTTDLLFKDNLIIGNMRDGMDNDVDLLLLSPDNITISTESTGNVVNQAVKRVDDAYPAIDIAGIQADKTFTYTSPEVSLNTEEGLPVLVADDSRILHGDHEVVSGVGISVGSLGVKVWPNPSDGMVELKAIDANENISYRIFSIVGEEILSGNTQNGIASLDLSRLTKGIYMLRLESGGKISITKLVFK